MADVLMPQMGESIVEGTVTKWLKNVGEQVERDEPLLEISTDKVDSEVPSPVAGVLQETLVPEGQTVPVNTVLAKIGDGTGAKAQETAEAPAPAEEAKPAAEAPSPAAPADDAKPAAEARPPAAEPEVAAPPPQTKPAETKTEAEPAQNGRRIRSSPLVRRLAKEHDIDLRQVKGTGQGGRISKKDIEAYLKEREKAAAAPPAAAPAAAPAPEAAPVPTAEPGEAFRPAPNARFGDFRVEPLSTMRKRIAEHMVLTKRVSPHVSTVHQVDMTAVATLRDQIKKQFQERNGVKLTYMPFFLRAAASALKEFPLVNASLDGDQIIYHKNINVGVAVALDWGLIVPVIKDVDEKSVLGLQRAVNDVASRSRNKQLKPEELQEGTFSISNYGAFGSLLATPAINQPQAAILGVGAVHKEPVVINDAIAIRSISYVTLTFDHRLIDGAVADQFLTHLKGVMENWKESVL